MKKIKLFSKIILIALIVSSFSFPGFYNARAAGLNTLYNLTGVQDGENFGFPTRFIGDVNNDGVEDFAIGAVAWDRDGVTDVGRVFIYSGSDGSIVREHTQPLDPLGITNPESAFFGSALSGIGDVNEDGFDDYAIQDPRFSTGLRVEGGTDLNELGKVIAYSGTDGSELWNYIGIVPLQFRFGNSLMMLTNDYNSDNKPDLAVGAPEISVNARDAGAILILDVTDGSLITQYDGTREEEGVGMAFDTGYDIDGNGSQDFIIGDFFYTDVQFAQGRVNVISGSDLSLPNIIHTVDTPAPGRFSFFGHFVKLIGDANADGINDFAVKSNENAGGILRAGSVRIYSGDEASLLRQYDGSSSDQRFGNALSDFGDVTNDGWADIIISSLMKNGSGRADVFANRPGTLWDRIPAGAAGDNAGSDIDGGKDINGDGISDLILGSTGGKVGNEEPGRARVIVSDPTHVWNGTNIEVFPVWQDRDFSITFSSVSSEGNVSHSYLGGTSAGGTFRTRQGNSEEGWNITTTATHSGTTRVCFRYDLATGGYSNENNIRVDHLQGGTWVQVTDESSRDTVNKIICGETNQPL